MPIKFRCEHCRQLLGISQGKAGEHVDCPTCGRSVQVPSLDGRSSSEPKPSWNPKDQSLLHALESLASLTSEDEPSPAHPASSKKSEEPSVPKPVETPEPIELPPLEKPVALSEPVQSPIVESSVPDDAESEESAEPMPMAEEPLKSDEPPAEVKLTAPLSDDPVPVAAVEKAISATSPVPSPVKPTSPTNPTKNGVSLTALVILSLFAFGAGYWVRGFSQGEQPPSSSLVTESSVEQPDEEDSSTETISENSDLRQAVEGRITYRTTEGNSQADDGAIVVILPVYRKSSGKLPITGFRPADSKEDREIARAAIRALGGDLVVVDSNGQYVANLPQAGEYHLLVLSRHRARAEGEMIDSTDVATLGDYFDRPRQLLGQLKFQVGTVNYRGETVEIWDHAFEAG